MAGRKEGDHEHARHCREGRDDVVRSVRAGGLGPPAWNVSYSVSCHGYCMVDAVKVMGSTDVS